MTLVKTDQELVVGVQEPIPDTLEVEPDLPPDLVPMSELDLTRAVDWGEIGTKGQGRIRR